MASDNLRSCEQRESGGVRACENRRGERGWTARGIYLILKIHGHITSISVLRSFRKLGLAAKLMNAAHTEMAAILQAKYVSLHVRVSNRAALALYKDKLQYEVVDIEIE